jgi:hypothetical protein
MGLTELKRAKWILGSRSAAGEKWPEYRFAEVK